MDTQEKKAWLKSQQLQRLKWNLKIQEQTKEIYEKYPEFFNNLMDYCNLFSATNDIAKCDPNHTMFIYGKQSVAREILSLMEIDYDKLYRGQLSIQDKRNNLKQDLYDMYRELENE